LRTCRTDPTTDCSL